jgi:hypothetical protein
VPANGAKQKMTIFQDAAVAHSAAVDMVYSECWTYLPYAAAGNDVNARPVADGSRPAQPIIGVYLDPYARAESATVRRQGVTPEKPGHASARPQLDLDVTQLPYRIQNGDRVVRLATGDIFKVTEPKFPSAGIRQQLDLNLLTPGSGG